MPGQGARVSASEHDDRQGPTGTRCGPRVVRGLKAAIRTRRPAILLTIGLLAFSALTLPKLDVNPDQLFFFKDDDPVRLAFEKTENIFGGATPLMGEFAYDPADGEEPLDRLAVVSAELEALPGVLEVIEPLQ